MSTHLRPKHGSHACTGGTILVLILIVAGSGAAWLCAAEKAAEVPEIVPHEPAHLRAAWLAAGAVIIFIVHGFLGASLKSVAARLKRRFRHQGRKLALRGRWANDSGDVVLDIVWPAPGKNRLSLRADDLRLAFDGDVNDSHPLSLARGTVFCGGGRWSNGRFELLRMHGALNDLELKLFLNDKREDSVHLKRRA